VECYPQERYSGGDQAPGEFVKAGNAFEKVARRLEQPVGDIVDRVVSRTPFGRTRHPPDDSKLLGEKRGRSRLSRCVARRFPESAGHRPQTWPASGRAQAAENVALGRYLRSVTHRIVFTPCPRGRVGIGAAAAPEASPEPASGVKSGIVGTDERGNRKWRTSSSFARIQCRAAGSCAGCRNGRVAPDSGRSDAYG
jgi:hypothetical protein